MACSLETLQNSKAFTGPSAHDMTHFAWASAALAALAAFFLSSFFGAMLLDWEVVDGQ